MRRDAVELDRFYRTAPGRTAQAMVLRRLAALWPDVKGLDLLGLGYAAPWLDHYAPAARRAVAFMPAGQGAVTWPGGGASRTALGDETRLPFPDALFDRVLMAHALEEAESLPALLREVWRVCAPQGRVMIVCANRSGLWARADSTPFGHGRPFSKGQLSGLLDDAAFEATAWARALYAPPWRMACGPRAGRVWEETGERLFPGFGGVILAEAVKRVAALTPRAAARTRRAGLEAGPAPALSPHGSRSASRSEKR